MELQPKTEPGFVSNDHMNLENMSIQDLVSVLRTAFLTQQFDIVEDVLVSRYEKLQTENQHLQDKFEMERLTRLQAEEDLKKREKTCERCKRAESNYEKLLKEVKKTSLGFRENIVELKKKNNELELEVCELRKLKEKWVDDSNALAEVRIRVDVLENEKNALAAFEVRNSELEKSMKKISETLADAGITAFQEKEIGEALTVEPDEDEPPSKRSKDAQGASSGMTPKPRSTGSKRKQAKTSQSRRSQPPTPYDANRFRTAHHAMRYQELLKRKFWHEKEFTINPEGKYNGIVRIIEERKWGRLVKPPRSINVDIVREFYANAIPTNPEEEFTFETFVRGRTISFDREAINTYLGNPLPLRDLEDLCAFHLHQAKGNWDHTEIKKGILKEGMSYDVSPAGRPFRALKQDMNLPAQVILNLILHNIRPKSHTSSTTLDVTPLIYYILAGKQVDVARIIAHELKTVALNGIQSPKCPLAFPGLIMGLCRRARIVLPAQVHEHITNPVDDAYIARHNEEKKTKNKSQASTSHTHPATATSEQPNFADLDPRL